MSIGNNTGNNIEIFLILLLLTICLFIICREFVCWYFKINERVDLDRQRNEVLKGCETILHNISNIYSKNEDGSFVQDDKISYFVQNNVKENTDIMPWLFIKGHQPLEKTNLKCPKCGAINKLGDNNCSMCGYIPRKPLYDIGIWHVMETKSGGTKIRYKQCPNCGTKYHLDAKCCRECGWEPTSEV